MISAFYTIRRLVRTMRVVRFCWNTIKSANGELQGPEREPDGESGRRKTCFSFLLVGFFFEFFDFLAEVFSALVAVDNFLS